MVYGTSFINGSALSIAWLSQAAVLPVLSNKSQKYEVISKVGGLGSSES